MQDLQKGHPANSLGALFFLCARRSTLLKHFCGCGLIPGAKRSRLGSRNLGQGVIMKLSPAAIVLVFAQIFSAGLSRANASNVVGSWKVEVAFGNGENRAFRFEARDSGKGSFLLLDPRSKFWGSTEPAEGEWTQGNESSVIFSGPVQFPLGNVGIYRGILVLKGKLGAARTITGEAKFFLLDQNPNDPKASPTKSGTFKATG